MNGHKEVVVPGSHLWLDFLSELGRAHRCFGTTEHARAVLSRMPNVDAEASLLELARMGGSCDCKIELDIGRGVLSA